MPCPWPSPRPAWAAACRRPSRPPGSHWYDSANTRVLGALGGSIWTEPRGIAIPRGSVHLDQSFGQIIHLENLLCGNKTCHLASLGRLLGALVGERHLHDVVEVGGGGALGGPGLPGGLGGGGRLEEGPRQGRAGAWGLRVRLEHRIEYSWSQYTGQFASSSVTSTFSEMNCVMHQHKLLASEEQVPSPWQGVPPLLT